ncbi:EF-Tu/IF-2/RF-3 family GTPase [uncultured Fibrobacter sp.]|uniref:EF-Tu/IF-2/RF-3 family GTPase n=1 Tax=uncultured Fibrobacter sp. TaxID=261512 RepID=UPI0025EC5D73|nr:EF-Tu/IF-2/RF-3 family GTPase [uncultured Fibrobacter sp.]
MTVKDSFVITGRGVVASGIVERGTVHMNDRVKCSGSTNVFTVTSITVGGKNVEEANKGDNVGLLLRGASKEDVSPGSVLCSAK